MRSNEEANKANFPQALNEINSNIKEITILKIKQILKSIYFNIFRFDV